MVRWDGVPFDAQDAAKAARVFRPDVYRSALSGTGDLLPGASSKVEGSLGQTTAVSAQQGTMILERNSFFDERSFDPDDLRGYLARCEISSTSRRGGDDANWPVGIILGRDCGGAYND